MFICKECNISMGRKYVPMFVALFQDGGIDGSGKRWCYVDADIVLCHYCGGNMHWEDEADRPVQSIAEIQPC